MTIINKHIAGSRFYRSVIALSRLTAGIALACAATTAMANDIIALQIYGVPGDAAFAQKYGLPANSIETLSLSSEVSNFGVGDAPGKAAFSGLTLLKHFGASSPALFLDIAEGRHLNTATVSFYHLDKDGPQLFYKINLVESYIVVDQISGSEQNAIARDAETITLRPRLISFEDVATGSSSCFDFAKNAVC